MAKCIIASGGHPGLSGFIREHLIQAEARGAAEQRRKDAEGAMPVAWEKQNLDGKWIWTTCHDFHETKGTPTRPLYTRPANVAALIAEAVASERQRCIEVVRQHGISPFPIDDPGREAEAINATLQNITEAICKGEQE